MADWGPLRRELEQQVRITARRSAIEWETQVKRDAPRGETGDLQRSVRMRDTQTGSGFKITGEVDTDYAEAVSKGTVPHIIKARNAKALRFTVGGTTLFRVRVNHPGTTPDDFWTRPLEQLPRTIQNIWAQVTA